LGLPYGLLTEFPDISSILRHYRSICRQLITSRIIDFLIHHPYIDQLLNEIGKKWPDNSSDHELPATGKSRGEKKAAPGNPGAAFGKEAV
jgi:hypothetical protein